MKKEYNRILWAKQIAAYRSSNLSAKIWCQNKTKSVHTLKYWIYTINKENSLKEQKSIQTQSNWAKIKISEPDEQIENVVDEESFFEVWDDIRSKSIFKTPSDNKSRVLIYSMLKALGYLSEIRIKDNRSSDMVDGYQFNEGAGRLFSLKRDL